MSDMGGTFTASAAAAEQQQLADALVGQQPSRSGSHRCPHCKCVAHRRTSRAITETHREIYYQCSNLACGHTWKASEVYDYGIVPSGIPDPAVNLPLRPMPRTEALALVNLPAPPDPNQPGLFD